MIAGFDLRVRFRPALCFLALVLLSLAACRHAAERRPERTLARLRSGEAVRIVAFGDSVTRGFGVTRPWPDRLATALRQAYPTDTAVINAGVDGNTAADGLARLGRDVLATSPDLVLIAFGLNDLKLQRSPPVMQHDLDQMVARIEATGAEVVLLTTNPIRAGLYGSALAGYNDAIRELARSRRLPLVDVTSAWREASDDTPLDALLIDIAHPSERGQQLTADAVYALLAGS